MFGKSVGTFAAALITLVAVPSTAVGQDAWPNKPITYVVPFAPGGNTDTLARIIAQKLSTSLGQPVVIENKPGAGGNIGSDYVAKSKPDGYTIQGGTISSHAINASVYPKMPYDVVKSFEPVIMIGSGPLVLATGSNAPYKSVQDVIAAAKAKPATISFASAGNGTSPHLAGELFKIATSTDLTHVPYKGSGPALTDVVAGNVPLIFDTMLVLGGQLKAGKIRPLAVASSKRIASLPDVPTFAEVGVPGFEVSSWQAVFAPAGTPKPIVQRLNADIAAALKAPDVAARLQDLGIDPSPGTPEQLGDYQKAEVAKWAKVVKAANIKPD